MSDPTRRHAREFRLCHIEFGRERHRQCIKEKFMMSYAASKGKESAENLKAK